MLAAMGVGLGLLGAFASPAAAVRTVMLETDNFMGSQPGELRYEIGQAVPGELVQIAPGVNPKLSMSLGFGGGGQILIDKDLIIEGQGADQTTISVPSAASGIFNISLVASQAVVTIRDLTMTNGHAPNGAAGAVGSSGGAIVNSEDLTLDQVAFVGNSAGDGGSGTAGMDGGPGDPGGAGGNGGGGGFGGAVFNTVGGDLTVMNSTFDSNFAGSGGAGGQGGDAGSGMFVVAGNGGNGGLGRDGGAIHNTGDLIVTNSTFFNNRSGSGGNGGDRGAGFGGAGGDGGDGGTGGAIHQGGAGSLTISSTTLRGNVASQGGLGGMGVVSMLNGDPGADGEGGGTYFHVMGPVPTVANTIYSQNTATTGPNCGGGAAIAGVGANLAFPAGTGCPGSFSSGDPQLGPLMDNGGPTMTMALGTGSAAIDAALTGLAIDQRGVARPQGPRCDIGAFELGQATIPGTTCAGPPASPLIPATTPLATGPAPRKCKKGRKLRKGKCVKKKRRK